MTTWRAEKTAEPAPDRATGGASSPAWGRLLVAGLAVLALVGGATFADNHQDDGSGPRSEWFGDLQIRGDFLDELPPPRDRLDRGRVRFRFGRRTQWNVHWETEFSLWAAESTGNTRANRRNLDNERFDAITADRALALRSVGLGGLLSIGKGPLPMPLASIVWDPELRPIGVGYTHLFDIGGLDTIDVGAGAWSVDHPFDEDPAMGTLHLVWRHRDGAPSGVDLGVTGLVFDRLEELGTRRVLRSNTAGAEGALADFELVVVEATGRIPAGSARLALQLVAVDNLGADRDDQAFEAAIVLDTAGPWAFDVAARRAQRDSVLAAVNDDSWWFPSAMRGVRLAACYRRWQVCRIEIALLRERLDTLDDALLRAIVDLNWAF